MHERMVTRESAKPVFQVVIRASRAAFVIRPLPLHFVQRGG